MRAAGVLRGTLRSNRNAQRPTRASVVARMNGEVAYPEAPAVGGPLHQSKLTQFGWPVSTRFRMTVTVARRGPWRIIGNPWGRTGEHIATRGTLGLCWLAAKFAGRRARITVRTLAPSKRRASARDSRTAFPSKRQRPA